MERRREPEAFFLQPDFSMLQNVPEKA